MSKLRTLTIHQARRMALAAQGLDRPRPVVRLDIRHVRNIIQQLGLLQLDYVNVLIPAHYQVLFSRLGKYPLDLFDRAVYQRREFTEQWAHEASIIPVELWPFLRHRMENHRVRPWEFEEFMGKHRDFVESVYEQVRERGPLSAAEIDVPAHLPRRPIGGAWSRSTPRCVLEAYFGRGEMAATERLKNFARRYDLSERVVPSEHLEPRVTPEEARKELLLRAAVGLGFGTAADLADYFRMPVGKARPLLEEMAREGKLQRGMVQGWKEEVFIHPEARLPLEVHCRSLLSPFDPVIWHRPRIARLFNFDYKLEIFMPAKKRRWGYYVLPFLLGTELVGRVDLKADRSDSTLTVLSAHPEPDIDFERTARALAVELRLWAEWLELEKVRIVGRRSFERKLRLETG